MTRHPSIIVLFAALVLFAAPACDKEQRASGPGLNVQVAPLSLPGIGNAEYTIVVRNGTPEVVWSRTVDSDRFGDGVGSISYVGPCDAQGNPHTVTLTLDKLWDTNTKLLASPTDYSNPGAITLTNVECRENGDVPVVFNLTIMRAADQGFFDISVNFKDVFCSAKIDCRPRLLHDGQTPGPTVVMAFACTAGQGTTAPESTWMYLSDVTLTCSGEGGATQTIELDEVTRPGQQGAEPPYLYEWAEYRGEEGFDDVAKCYWNHAFGLDLELIGNRTCTLSATGTASDVPLVGGAIASDVVWPVVNFDVDVVTGGALCGPNPLDGSSGVWTSYVTPGTTPRPAAFTAAYRCGGDPTPVGFACTGTDASFQPTTVGDDAAVQVTVGGVTSAPFKLPAGSTLDESCCLANCCSAP